MSPAGRSALGGQSVGTGPQSPPDQSPELAEQGAVPAGSAGLSPSLRSREGGGAARTALTAWSPAFPVMNVANGFNHSQDGLQKYAIFHEIIPDRRIFKNDKEQTDTLLPKQIKHK